MGHAKVRRWYRDFTDRQTAWVGGSNNTHHCVPKIVRDEQTPYTQPLLQAYQIPAVGCTNSGKKMFRLQGIYNLYLQISELGATVS